MAVANLSVGAAPALIRDAGSLGVQSRGHLKKLTEWAVAILLTVSSAFGQMLVPAGAIWKYLDTGTDQGTAWSAPEFDDTLWKSGPAELGYGDGDEATVVSFGPDSNHKYITTYFRRTFTVPDPLAYASGLTLRVRRDDGAAVYLNGVEVFRSNLAAGALYNTYGNTASDGGKTWQVTTVPPSLLTSGANVFAVEIHQATAGSSDISFNLELNASPTVSITSPAGGATVVAGATTQITAAAADIDGNIANVVFYAGASSLGTDSTAPYSHSWKPTLPGVYTLTAQAKDNSNGVTTSQPVSVTVVAANTPPGVSITSPVSGTVFIAPAAVTISATAADSDGTITSVSFYNGATLLGTDTTSPYTWDWSVAAAGTYSLTAKARDNANAVTTSASVGMTVVSANIPPSVSISSPNSGATFTAPATITINATAADSDGTITSVSFYNGATLLGTDTTSPYSWDWSGAAAGTHSLTAKAKDNANTVTTSPSISVTVTAAQSQGPPQAVIAVAGDAAATIMWMPVGNAVGYTVWRSTSPSGPYSFVAGVLNPPAYVDSNLVNGTFYFYVVTATTADGESPASNVARVTPTSPFPAGVVQWPLSRSAAANGDGIRHPFGPRNIGSYDSHAGLDIPAPLGTPIYPAMDGIVEAIVNPSSGLKKAIVKHGNNRWTQYLHVSAFAPGLTVGHSVTKNDVIAYVGHSDASHDHLHFTYVVKPDNSSISETRSKNPLEILPYNSPTGLTAQWLPDNSVSISMPSHQMSVRWIVLQGGGVTRIADYYDIVSQGSGDSERNSKDQYGVHIDADSPGNGPDGAELPFLLKLSPAAPDNYVLERVLLLDFNGQVLLDAHNNN